MGRAMIRRAIGPLTAMASLLAASCGATISGAAEPARTPTATTTLSAPATTNALASGANHEVCIDLDARGGQLYTEFVVPMMTDASGQKSVEVEIAIISRAIAQDEHVGANGSLDQASGKIADEDERMVAAAEAFQAVDHFEGTALLTSFVGLAVACQEAGHKPSWFDAASLMSS